MKIGFCAGPEAGPLLKEAGYDFLELNVQTHLCSEKPASEFRSELAKIKECPLPCLAANCLVPASMKLTGEDTDYDKIEKYLISVFRRAEESGIQTIVFGSGGARTVPEGFNRVIAYEQLLDFGNLAADYAGKHGVTVVVEPLNKAECNIFNSTRECAQFVQEINKPSLKLLVDSYHWHKENEEPDAIIAAGKHLQHIHVATYSKRLAPGAEKCEFGDFFRSLKMARYSGPVSIETFSCDIKTDAAPALSLLRSLCE